MIQVPIRWCVLEGTTTDIDPSLLGEPDTDTAILHRLQRATDQIWLPGENIVFRSAMTVDVIPPANFPVIDDPHRPSDGGPGVLGDVSAPSTGDPTERDDAVKSCETAWDALAAAAGVTLYGPIAISVQQFVDSLGTPSLAEGQSGLPTITTTAGVTHRLSRSVADHDGLGRLHCRRRPVDGDRQRHHLSRSRARSPAQSAPWQRARRQQQRPVRSVL